MAFVIRPAGPPDLPAVLAIERACFSRPWSEGQLLAWMGEGHGFLVCLDGEVVLGYVNLQTVLDQGDIGNVAVDPAHRRRGAADALLSALDAFAQARGLACLQLEVRAGNAPALALYTKHGYETVGLRRGYYREPREDAVLMTKYFA